MFSIKNKDSKKIVNITKHELFGEDKILLAPDNTLELFQVLKGSVDIQMLGKARPMSLQTGRYIIIKPRSRGMEVRAKQSALVRIIKIVPINLRRFTDGREEIANGIYSNDSTVSTNRQPKPLEDLVKAEEVTPTKARSSDTLRSSLEMIKEANGHIKVRELYNTLNISKSTLEHHFMKEIGLTPKEFCKIEKLNYFIKTYKKEEGTLTELTYKCGYYDQSHLIKDFKYFLNTSPKKYLKGSSAH